MAEQTPRAQGTLAVIGGGRMGEAIVGGLIEARTYAPDSITVAEPSARRRDVLAAEFGVRTAVDYREAERADTVVLAVKPQVIDAVVTGLSAELGGSLLVSIAAGVSCARLEALLPAGTAVVRVMPNTPALVGEAMSVVSGGSEASAEQVEAVRSLFAGIGTAIVLPEAHQDIATAISGSGPAYFALVVESLTRAGVRHGLSRDIAQTLATQTMLGTAKMLSETGVHPESLIDGVSSPAGTTIAALEALESRALRATFAEAVSAAVKRSKELGS